MRRVAWLIAAVCVISCHGENTDRLRTIMECHEPNRKQVVAIVRLKEACPPAGSCLGVEDSAVFGPELRVQKRVGFADEHEEGAREERHGAAFPVSLGHLRE